MKKYKINEIFYSLQGEGYRAGQASVFIRFSGCNLKCPFCDTKHEEGTMYTAEEIVAQVRKYACKWVVLTGGEPTLFADRELVSTLHNNGLRIAVETNGTTELETNYDFITCSPKYEFVQDARLKIQYFDELKVVYDGTNDMTRYNGFDFAPYLYIQPCDTGDAEKNKEIVAKCVEYVKANPEWRLSLQTQKILNIQ